MQLQKRYLMFSFFIILILLCSTAQAESDPTGDVYYFNGPDADVLWEFFGDKDHIDITDASFTTTTSDITVSLTVQDSISDDQKIKYYLRVYTNPTSFYDFNYNEESGIATGNGDLAGYVDTNPDYTISDDGKTISYTFTDVDTSLSYTMKAYAVEFVTYGATYDDAWYDYAPESEAPYFSGGSGNDNGNDNNGGGNGQGGTPGFEMVTVFVALAAIFLFTLKRKY